MLICYKMVIIWGPTLDHLPTTGSITTCYKMVLWFFIALMIDVKNDPGTKSFHARSFFYQNGSPKSKCTGPKAILFAQVILTPIQFHFTMVSCTYSPLIAAWIANKATGPKEEDCLASTESFAPKHRLGPLAILVGALLGLQRENQRLSCSWNLKLAPPLPGCNQLEDCPALKGQS